MIDLHIHSTLGVGSLTPAAALRQARLAGCRAAAIADQADAATLGLVLAKLLPLTREYGLYMALDALAGVELTQVPPQLMADAVAEARRLGAQLVLAYGESLADSVPVGTNLAAIEAGVDILSHPGLISETEAALAAEKGVLLELSCYPGHSLANGHLAAVARRCKAKLILGSDARCPADFFSGEQRRAVALGAGLTPEEYLLAEANARALVHKLLGL
jgi:histidinol phosphatase-like PHP family hydrolase